MKKGYTYRDIDLTFKAHPVTGDIVAKTDVRAVMQSLKNLVLTSPGEILMEPELGAGFRWFLFNPNDMLTRYDLQSKLEEIIRNHEPRIELKEIKILPTPDGRGVVAQVTFYMLNSPDPYTEELVISRLR